jgi:hypothetical protein
MTGETFHVVPVGDLMLHEEVQDACPCGPLVHFFPRGKIVIHHALDGRHAADPGWPVRRAEEVAQHLSLSRNAVDG